MSYIDPTLVQELFEEAMRSDVEREVNFVLDGGEAQPTALDLALIGEAVIDASVRRSIAKEAYEKKQTVAGREFGSLEGGYEYEKIYKTHFPKANIGEDAVLVNLKDLEADAIALQAYGESPARYHAWTELRATYAREAVAARAVVDNLKLSALDRVGFYVAVNEFASDLYSIGFIEKDDMLVPPLRNLGEQLLDSFALTQGFSPRKARKEWLEYINQATEKGNLIGENPEVMSDTTTFFIEWTGAAVANYLKQGTFDTSEFERKRGAFDAYGEDAPYLEEVRRLREAAEAASGVSA